MGKSGSNVHFRRCRDESLQFRKLMFPASGPGQKFLHFSSKDSLSCIQPPPLRTKVNLSISFWRCFLLSFVVSTYLWVPITLQHKRLWFHKHMQLCLALDEHSHFIFLIKVSIKFASVLPLKLPVLSINTVASGGSFLLNRYWIECSVWKDTHPGDLLISSGTQHGHVTLEMVHKGSKVSAAPTDIKERSQIWLVQINTNVQDSLKSKDNGLLSKVCYFIFNKSESQVAETARPVSY